MVLKMRTLSLPIPRTKEDLLVPLKTFSFRELKLATDCFSKKSIVGRGGSGCVYRGRLADGSLVAIKRINEERGELQFQTEVDIGGSQASNHRNVLRLLGYCRTQKERILVYPFIVHMSLDSRLWERDPSESPLDWSTRKRIALGAAKGLAHFHHGPFTVIHRDIKPSNILLDDQFEAVLCDFGLAKIVGNNSNSSWVQRPDEEEHYDDEDPSKEEEDESDHEDNYLSKSCWNFTRKMRIKAEDGEESRVSFTKNEVIAHATYYHDLSTHISSGVYGTFGYVAPEYFNTGKCSVKNDVYGYGVVLLELVTGQRAFDRNRLANDGFVSKWVKRILGDDDLDSVVDSDLRGDYIKKEVKQLIRLALSCTEADPKKRPVMTEVINIIENMGQSPSVDQFFEKVSPNVIQPPFAATTQLIQEQFEAHATDPTNSVQFESTPVQSPEKATLDVAGWVTTASDLGDCVRRESSHEIEPARVQPEPVVLPQFLEPGTNKNKRDDFQVNITSGDFSLSFKFSRLSAWCAILLISLCMNLVSIWGWAKPRY